MTEHVIALSGGKDSTAMAIRLQELNPTTEYKRVITPTGDELPDMFEHWRHLADLLGPLTVVTSDTTLEGLIERWDALPNWRQRWCTRALKIEPYHAWLVKHAPCVSYVGLRADEESRAGMEFRSDIEGVRLEFPMRSWGWGLSEVLAYLDQKGVTIPDRTDCGSCFFQTLGEWWELWKERPELYEKYEGWELAVSEKRGKTTTFRSEARDAWPAGLSALRSEFESGARPRGAGQADLFKSARCRTCSL